MLEEGAKCSVCQAVTDGFGDHQVSCGGNSDCILRHNGLRDTLFSAAQSAALAPKREVPSLIPQANSRPTYMYLPWWKCGKPAALDVTVIFSLQKPTSEGDPSTQDHALQVREDQKQACHRDACPSVRIHFIPLAVVTRRVES